MISRRKFLQASGVSIALPAFAAQDKSKTKAEIPLRYAFIFVPNGVIVPDFFDASLGKNGLPPTLQALAPHKKSLLRFSNLTQKFGFANGDGAGDHARSSGSYLTSAQCRKTSGKDIHAATSFDQLLAQKLPGDHLFPSLELGCENSRLSGGCDSGYSCAYSSNISWSSASTPRSKEINPRLLFERLFGQGDKVLARQDKKRKQAENASILDLVQQETQSLKKNLPQEDRERLDQYLQSIRQVEKRLQKSEKQKLELPANARPPKGIPRSYAEHLELMYEMMALAFQTNRTRVISFMHANGGSNRSYRELDISGGHHSLSHHQGDEQKITELRRINTFHITHYANFIKRLKSIEAAPNQAGTLLDHCTLLYGSGISDGNRHNHNHLPMLLAGGQAHGIRAESRYLQSPNRTPLSNLFLSLAQCGGLDLSSVANSTGSLKIS